jgi:hypothetical protein
MVKEMARTLLDYVKSGGIKNRIFCDKKIKSKLKKGKRGANYHVSDIIIGANGFFLAAFYTNGEQEWINAKDHLYDVYVGRR